MCFLTGTFRDDGGRQRLRQLSVHRKHNQPPGSGVSVALQDLTLHSLHQQNHLPRTLRAFFFGHVGERGGHELTDKCTLRRRNNSLLINISEAHFCTKIKRESNPVSKIMFGTLSLCVQWVLTVTVSIPWCHIATRAHTQCAVSAPVALQTPHAVHSSTGGLSALFVAIMISFLFYFEFVFFC